MAIILTEKDKGLYDELIKCITSDLKQKIYGTSWTATLELDASRLEDKNAFLSKIKTIKKRGSTESLLRVREIGDKILVIYVVK